MVRTRPVFAQTVTYSNIDIETAAVYLHMYDIANNSHLKNEIVCSCQIFEMHNFLLYYTEVFPAAGEMPIFLLYSVYH